MHSLHERLRAEAKVIGRSEKLDFTNIANYFAAHPQNVWVSEDDIPNWAPPFSNFFVEWAEPKHWNIDGELVTQEHSGQSGIHVMAAHVTDEDRDDRPSWLKLIARFAGGDERMIPESCREKMLESLPNSKWVLCCSSWTSIAARPICGHPLWMGNIHYLFVRPDGSLYSKWGISFTPVFFRDQNAFWTPINILGLGLSFMHCKNVTVNEHADRRSPRWHEQHGIPICKFKTLDINPMREVLRRDGKSDEVGLQRALHICRGHFATYTEEHPLFGKYVGTFFRPAHVRGQSEAGVVVKDYKPGVPR